MTKVEEELRAAFERQEAVVPEPGPVRDRIAFAWVRAKRRRARRRALGAAAAVLLAGAALPVVSASWRHGGQPEAESLIGTAEPASVGPVDVLLIGSDRRAGSKVERADTIMLLHIPADHSAAWMVSIPRDGLVEIPGKGRQKLTTTLTEGGPALTRSVVAKLTGVEPIGTVTVDFTALRAVTELVGGVRMCLDQAVPAQSGRPGFAAGCQQIDADEVTPLLQARQGLERYVLDRDRNTQRFLTALAAKVTADHTTASPDMLRQLLIATGDGIRVDGDEAALLGAARALGQPELIGIGAPRFNSTPDGEIVDSKQMQSLYQAIRDDQLEKWAAANPDFVTR